MKNRIILLISIVTIALCSCNKTNQSAMDLFVDKEEIKLFMDSLYFEKDSLAKPYLLTVIDTFLLVHDVYDMKHFTVFNTMSRKCVTRFGNIGIGPGELSIGNVLSVRKKAIYSFDIPRRYIFKYNLNDFINEDKSIPKTIAKFEHIPETHLSRVISVGDSCFLGGGVYKSKYQHLLFDEKGNILDYGIETFHHQESFDNMYKFLSNQGILISHPEKNKHVYTVKNSANIDFIEIENKKLKLVKSHRLNDPQFKNEDLGKDSYSIDYDKNTVIGYMDVAPAHNFVYTLYADKSIVNKNGKYNSRSSDIVLVFDWEGNPIKKYKLNKEVYYITVDEDKNIIYALLQDKDFFWNIVSFNIETD